MTDVARAPDTARPRVLLVEDDRTVRDHIARALSDEFQIDAAGNGTEALKLVLHARPDVVATDVVMPDLDGIELLKTLRSTPSTRLIPVLLMSGRAPDEIRIEGFEQGADGYLPKPYTERELRARLRALVQIAKERAEAARREALEQAEREAITERAALLESITDPFYALDQQWRFTYLNQLAVDYFRKPREELLGRSLWEVVPEAVGSEFEVQYRRAVRERRSISFEVLSPFSKRWVDVHVYPSRRGVAVNFRDITDRKRVEQALHESEAAVRRSEERYRAFVTHSSEGIWRYELREPLDPSAPVEVQMEHLYQHSYLAEANDAMARMYGYERAEELIGTGLEQTLPRTDPSARAYLLKVIESGYLVSDVESVERDRHGQERRFANSMVPVFHDGKLVRAWGMQRDVTARALAEERLARSEREVREANRRKDEFLATLAHELRNPLAPMRNAAQLLKIPHIGEAQARTAREIIERQIQHMVRLVDDLLDVSRITLGQVNLRQEKLSLGDLITDALEAARPLIESGGQTLDVHLPTTPLLIEGDGTRLSQVFQNLLNNASKYTPAGGQITVRARQVGAEAAISVKDTGMGISKEAQERIFELFTRVHPSDSIKVSGLGIGLALARQLVELHGGHIEVRSEGAGFGSEFTVYLPVLDAPKAESVQTPDVALASARSKRKVLVVDDNRDAAESLAMLLQASGCEVKVAFNGAQALEIFAHSVPEVVLLDIGMPEMDGYEVARRLRGTARGRDVLLIALTGWGQAEDKRRAAEAGFDEHVTKPIDPEKLGALLS